MTPRPVMAGIHSAVVIGDAGEEIHSEQYGRVKVSFFWDHRKTITADNGIWVRVIQPWAGNTWGWQSLPRVGCEVAVAFFDGDPDRPVIVGGLYNADMMPVFPVSDQQTKSGLRTRSTTAAAAATSRNSRSTTNRARNWSFSMPRRTCRPRSRTTTP